MTRYFRLSLILLLGAISLTTLLFAQEARIDGAQRSLAADILLDVYKDVKTDYYDPAYHGVDIETRYRQASEIIKKATSFNQALGAVAWYLDALNDSHTFFVPPSRAFRLDYGYRLRMVGDKCLVVAVKPGTDAERQGLKPGDEVLTIATVTPNRENLWKLDYLFNTLRPQPGMHLDFRHPNGGQTPLDIQAEIARSEQIITIDNFWKEVVEAQQSAEQYERHGYDINKEVLIWKLPSYMMNEQGVDSMIGEARGHKALILDLRGNGGGRVDALERMIGNVFDHDVVLGTVQERKKTEKEIAKTRGGRAFTGKLIVLIDSESASAAELFARVIQLEKRGVVIGDRSAGAVMEAIPKPHSVGIDRKVYYGNSVTIGNVVMTDGRSLEHVGVTPDEVVLPAPEDLAAGRDPVLARAAALAGVPMSAEQAGKLFPVKWIKFK